MANCVDFNRKYKFKLSHSNDIDRYASVIDEEIENKVMEIREKLNLGIDPISNLLEVIEELGLIVIFIEFKIDFRK